MNPIDIAGIDEAEISANGESAVCTMRGKDGAPLLIRLDRTAMANVATTVTRLSVRAENERRKQAGLYERQSVPVLQARAYAERGFPQLVLRMQTTHLVEDFQLRLDQAKDFQIELGRAIEEAEKSVPGSLS